MTLHAGDDPQPSHEFPGGTDRKIIGVVGAGITAERSATAETAEEVGALIARRGAALVCGGLGGVMAAACRGAHRAGGLTIGLLPGDDPAAANPWVDVAIPTGLGEARNLLVVRTAMALVAVGGGFGTLSEIALARKLGKPVIGLRTWSAQAPDHAEPLVHAVQNPVEAVARAIELAAGSPRT